MHCTMAGAVVVISTMVVLVANGRRTFNLHQTCTHLYTMSTLKPCYFSSKDSCSSTMVELVLAQKDSLI